MDGSATSAAVGHDKVSGRLVPGHSEWQARKLRLAALVGELSREYNATSPVAQQLLQIAAQHLDQAARTRNSSMRGRATRLATRLLDRLDRKPQQPKLNAFDEYVKDKYGVTP
jgi:hypothetical protein